MNLKNIYFSWLIYWGKMKGLLNGIAEAIILLASLASFFVLIYQFGFVQTPDSVHILERSRPFILLAFFTGITLRYVVRFQEIIQEKMLYLDISIYFLFKSRKTKRDGCEKRNAFIETKTKCASNLIRKVTAYLQNQSKTPSLYIKINGIQMDF